MVKKKCPVCKKMKNAEKDFYTAWPNGAKMGKCTVCHGTYTKKWYSNHMERKEKYRLFIEAEGEKLAHQV